MADASKVAGFPIQLHGQLEWILLRVRAGQDPRGDVGG